MTLFSNVGIYVDRGAPVALMTGFHIQNQYWFKAILRSQQKLSYYAPNCMVKRLMSSTTLNLKTQLARKFTTDKHAARTETMEKKVTQWRQDT
ncbi:hypothetical protein OUZ56_016328 [Daphnia magna]|uniref:Uncharacterized protein n=1 Tax=Daphnia magna TaxID=35525 RepID=A0ABR0AQC9_9CRUS|nr:hypothetical protein OUZ56_016328 [Daphnia magna]